jgi:hypothetical protein
MQTRTHTYKRSCVHRARMIILTHRICHFSYYRHDPNTANSWLEDLLFAWHGRIFRHISIIARGTTQGGTSQTKAKLITSLSHVTLNLTSYFNQGYGNLRGDRGIDQEETQRPFCQVQ